jgi:hypothetical protein
MCINIISVAAHTQIADLNTMSTELSSIKKKAEAAALVLDEVMNRSGDLIESYKVARAEITLGEARRRALLQSKLCIQHITVVLVQAIGKGSFGTVFKASYHGQAVAVK